MPVGVCQKNKAIMSYLNQGIPSSICIIRLKLKLKLTLLIVIVKVLKFIVLPVVQSPAKLSSSLAHFY